MKPSRLDKLTLFADLGYAPHPGQWRVHQSTAHRRVLACGTRWGKSTCAAMECVAAILEPRESSLGWVVAPTYDLAQRIYNRIRTTIATHFEHRIKEINPKERSLTLINLAGGTSEVRAKSADNPDSLLGEALDWLVLDEAMRVGETIWREHLTPRLVDRRGWALVISTPAQCDHWFYRLYRRGQKRRDPLVESWSSPTWENPHISHTVVEEERQRLPAEIFNAQYGAEFQGHDPEPCDLCGGPSPAAPSILIFRDGQEPGRCPECHLYVNAEGRTLAHRRADGVAMEQVIILQGRRDGSTPNPPMRCQPEVEGARRERREGELELGAPAT